MRRCHPAASGSAGFTLLEVLVAITLLGLLSVGLFGSVRVGGQGWRRTEQHRAATADVIALQDVLRRMIAAAKPDFASADPADRTVAFDGEAQSLAFTATLPDAIAPGQQGRLRLFLARAGATQAGATQAGAMQTLMLAWRLDVPASDGGSLPEKYVVLLDHVRGLRFAYCESSHGGAAFGCSDSWSGRDTLPALVRLHVERDSDAPGPWPDLVAAPLATVSSECSYAGLDPACHKTP
jgi:general secretion pathway protein J